jgi:hypothetical protein
MAAKGFPMQVCCRVLDVSQYGGLKADDVKRLKELQAENTQFKRLLAEAELEMRPCGNWPRDL